MTYTQAAQLASIEIALNMFKQRFPTYETTHSLDTLRSMWYARLDAQKHVYLDYTGGSLYADGQVREHLELLCNHVFGNPHSTNPASQAMTDLVEQARRYILTYFHASSDEYVVIFTPNASGALKLVAESYPFARGGQCLLTFDNHNSVNGMREFAHAKDTPVTYVPIEPPDLRVNEDHLYRSLSQASSGQPNLFAGGTITLSSVLAYDATGHGFYLTPGEAGFEDGTINYLMIPAVEIGLRYLAAIGIEMIHERVQCLSGWLLEALRTLSHSNGQPVVQIYGPISTERRGGTIAFNVCDPSGALFDCYAIQEEINQHGISIRSGCFCNPGVREFALGLTREGLVSVFNQKERLTYEQFLQVIDDHKQGALRVSVGLVTNFSHIYRFLQFVQTMIDRPALAS